MKFVVCKWLLMDGYRGVTLYPYIVMKDASLQNDKVFVNHESIHFHQQKELLVIPFYIIYLLEFVVRYFQYKDFDKAYRNISFEREAYANEYNTDYLKNRSKFSWVFYLFGFNN